MIIAHTPSANPSSGSGFPGSEACPAVDSLGAPASFGFYPNEPQNGRPVHAPYPQGSNNGTLNYYQPTTVGFPIMTSTASWPVYSPHGTMPYQQAQAPYSWPMAMNAVEPQRMGYGQMPYQVSVPNGDSPPYPHVFTQYAPPNASRHHPARHPGIGKGAIDTTVDNSSIQDEGNLPRGPPRKPRQSDYALWVGNLPLGATVGDLKDHFSQEARNDIESIKLISKSSCAFVNYRTQASCAAAMLRFHESRFFGSKLVCRLRRSSSSIAATNGVLKQHSPPRPGHGDMSPHDFQENGFDRAPSNGEMNGGLHRQPPSPGRGCTRVFVLKSLTLQDLERSVKNSVWATQPHNEPMLNEAFEVSSSSLF